MKTGRQIGKLDLRGLHKLRLRAKRMRYTIEFARSLYDKKSNRKRIERVLKDLGKLQSALGNLNDIASRKSIVERIVAERKDSRKDKPGTTSRLVAMISGDQKKQKSKQLDKAAKAFDKLENIKPFWT